MKRDVEAKLLELRVVENDVDVKSKALVDLEPTPTLSLDDVMELATRERSC